MIRYSDPFARAMPLRRLLDRILEEANSAKPYEQDSGYARGPEAQVIPVNIFQTPDQIVLVAPMPGAHPDDIEATVSGDTVYLRSELRGPHQEDKNYMVREWSYGPYERTIALPCGVDAERANASYDNGLLVLNLPKRNITRAHRITLQGDNSDHGLREARSGQISDGNGSHASAENRGEAPAAASRATSTSGSTRGRKKAG
ncbi:MAG TPA: Hsp20/alpha crystallin family protein [Armatimonadota bacterium]|nr:Hsp20/alpha crystallin family protein [Armatimonadota bacterium]